MRAYEETWEANLCHITTLDERYRVADFFILPGDDEVEPSSFERTALASAAPEMYRMLLSLEWTSAEGEHGALPAACPRCLNLRLDGHAAGCGLSKILKRARGES
jgi:hypothetical protein